MSILRERVKMEKFELFLDEPERFWTQKEVRKKMKTIWPEIEAFEDASMDHRIDRKMVPETLLEKTAAKFGMSVEMICDKIGQEIVQSRKLKKERLKIAPNGAPISIRPKYEEFIDNECGKDGDFWKQGYVSETVRDAQFQKITRKEAAEKLGVKIPILVKKIKKLNDLEELSDYERVRQENIADRHDFFGKLNFDELKNDLKNKKIANGKVTKQILPSRPKSVRIQKMTLTKSNNFSSIQSYVPSFNGLKLSQTLSIMQNRLENVTFWTQFLLIAIKKLKIIEILDLLKLWISPPLQN